VNLTTQERGVLSMLKATSEHGADRRTRLTDELKELVEGGIDRRNQTVPQFKDVSSAVIQGLPDLTWSEAKLFTGDKQRIVRSVKKAIKKEVSLIRQDRFIDWWVGNYILFHDGNILRQDFRPLSENDPEYDPFTWLVLDDGKTELEKILEVCEEFGLKIKMNRWPKAELWHRRHYTNTASSVHLIHLLDAPGMLDLIKEGLANQSHAGISIRELLLLLLMLKIAWCDEFWKRLPRALKQPILCAGSGFQGFKRLPKFIPEITLEEDGLYFTYVQLSGDTSEDILKQYSILRVHPTA